MLVVCILTRESVCVDVVTGLTFVSRVHPLRQQEAAELFFSQLSILDFH